MANERKHIMLFSIHYHPEMIGIGLFNRGLAEYLSEKYDVTVVTAFPWYPYWRVMDGYRGKFLMEEVLDGVRVKRSFVYPPRKVTSKTRILHEAVFLFSSLFNLLPMLFEKVDLVLTVCPPLGLGLSARLFCGLKRIPHVYHVQDLQVDAAFDMGMLKSRSLLRALRYMERYILRKATAVTTISGGMKRMIAAKGVDERRIALFPNWIDVKAVRPMADGRFRDANGIGKDKFVVLYAGNIGEKQGVEIIIDAASMTRSVGDIQYVIVGEGANRDRLKSRAEGMRLDNVMLLPLQTREMLPHMLAAADLSLIIQKRSVGDIVMPSKLLNIMASGRPVVASASPECELAGFIRETSVGLAVDPEDPAALKDAVLRFRSDRGFGRLCGERARAYAVEHLSRDAILGDFERGIQALLNAGTQPGISSTVIPG